MLAGGLARVGEVTRSLRNRNYRLFFFGQGMSLIGTWMQRTALGWLVYRITGSEWKLGVVGFAGQILTFVLAPFAGVLADRVDRRRLLVVTQVAAMVQAVLLAGLTLTGVITVWQIIALSTMLGLINAFDIPIRQSFVVEMLESRNDLPNAIAMNSFLVNGAKFLGPMLAGWLIAATSEGLCFVLNGVTFVAVIAALLAMRVKPSPHKARDGHVLHHLREGAVYAVGFAPIRAILLLLAVFSLVGLPYALLLPVFAKNILAGGPRMLGYLWAANAVGALGGAVFLASRKSVRGLGRALAVAGAIFGAALMGFAFSQTPALSLVLMAAVGLGMMVLFASSNSLIQTMVDDDKRGRVMSFYVMTFMGMGPFGALLIAWLAERFGSAGAVAIGGAGCILAALVFALRLPHLGRLAHPVYVRLGLAPSPPPAEASAEREDGVRPLPVPIPTDARL